ARKRVLANEHRLAHTRCAGSVVLLEAATHQVGEGRQELALQHLGHGGPAALPEPQGKERIAWRITFPRAVVDLEVGQVTAAPNGDRAGANTANWHGDLMQGSAGE